MEDNKSQNFVLDYFGHKSFLESLQTTFGTKSDNNGIELPSDKGKGRFDVLEVSEDMTVIICNATFYKTLKVHLRPEREQNELMFLFQNGKHNIDPNKKFNLTDSYYDRSTWTFSGAAEAIINIPEGSTMMSVSIVVSKDWMKKNFSGVIKEDELVSQLLLRVHTGVVFDLFREDYRKTIVKLLVPPVRKKTFPVYARFVAAELVCFLVEGISGRPTSSETNTIRVNINDQDKILQLLDFISSNIDRSYSLEEICAIAAISKSKLQRIFQQVFGKSVFQHITDLRLQRASVLLEDFNYTISEVAYSTGYRDIAHFSTSFKNHFKVSPSQYRNNIKLSAN